MCGPRWLVERAGGFAAHEKVCPMVTVACQNAGCGAVLPRSQIGYHVAHECVHRKIRCMWCSKGWGIQVRARMGRHSPPHSPPLTPSPPPLLRGIQEYPRHYPRCMALHIFAAWKSITQGHRCDDCDDWSGGASTEAFVSAKRLKEHAARHVTRTGGSGARPTPPAYPLLVPSRYRRAARSRWCHARMRRRGAPRSSAASSSTFTGYGSASMRLRRACTVE